MVDGVKVGHVGPIQADSLSITPSVTTVQSTSKSRYGYGQVLESVNIAQPSEFAMALKEVTGDVLTMAFLGTSSAHLEVSGTLTDFDLTITKLGVWLALGQKNLGELISAETAAIGGTTLVEGTDYRLNRPLGWFMALAGGALDVGDHVFVTGAYAGATGTVVKGSTRTEVRAEIVFDGINQADGTQCTATIWEAVLAPDSEFDFLADEFGLVNLTGTLKTPVGKESPYEVLLQDPVAA
ncbi:hypothetical protein [Comamonas antarctica]|uniref:phage tail tube protein n=1 Tax=Comamonas antarctica TaxID=2743470 RepID=UPI0028EC3841|nr:hypothetical protein [Comamonas antarctica]